MSKHTTRGIATLSICLLLFLAPSGAIANSGFSENTVVKENLRLSEVFPNPAGKDETGVNEWIELENLSDDTVLIEKFSITRTTANKTYSTTFENLEIEPYGFSVIKIDFPIVNKNGEYNLVIDDEILDTLTYSFSVSEDHSVSLIDGKWVETEPSEGYENFTEPEEVEEENIPNTTDTELETPLEPEVLGEDTVIQQTIEEVEESAVELGIITSGTVTVETGILADGVAYIQDNTGGIRIDTDQQLEINTVVEVEGDLSSFHGELRVEAEKITPNGTDNPIESAAIKTGEIHESQIGTLVLVRGFVTKTSGNTVYVNDGTGDIKVTIQDSTGIERPTSRKGYFAEVQGILSVWDENNDGTPNYRLLPRFQSDVSIKPAMADTGSPTQIGALAIIIIASVFAFIKFPSFIPSQK